MTLKRIISHFTRLRVLRGQDVAVLFTSLSLDPSSVRGSMRHSITVCGKNTGEVHVLKEHILWPGTVASRKV